MRFAGYPFQAFGYHYKQIHLEANKDLKNEPVIKSELLLSNAGMRKEGTKDLVGLGLRWTLRIQTGAGTLLSFIEEYIKPIEAGETLTDEQIIKAVRFTYGLFIYSAGKKAAREKMQLTDLQPVESYLTSSTIAAIRNKIQRYRRN